MCVKLTKDIFKINNFKVLRVNILNPSPNAITTWGSGFVKSNPLGKRSFNSKGFIDSFFKKSVGFNIGGDDAGNCNEL